jgi:hypothetical protein
VIRTLLVLFLAVFCAFSGKELPDWRLTLDAPARVRASAEIAFDVKLTDVNGVPVEDARVDFVLSMVGMDHQFRIPAKRVEPGVYRAKPTFYMPGKWTVQVRAKKGPLTLDRKFTPEINVIR